MCSSTNSTFLLSPFPNMFSFSLCLTQDGIPKTLRTYRFLDLFVTSKVNTTRNLPPRKSCLSVRKILLSRTVPPFP